MGIFGLFGSIFGTRSDKTPQQIMDDLDDYLLRYDVDHDDDCDCHDCDDYDDDDDY